MIANLSVPWGEAGDDSGGYHLVWPRDAVESGLGLAAVGQLYDAARMAYLAATQEDDGHWAQNCQPDGEPYWTGVQLDETAFPILLAARLADLDAPAVPGAPAMVRRAAASLAAHGPRSPWWTPPAGAPTTVMSTTSTASTRTALRSTGPEWGGCAATRRRARALRDPRRPGSRGRPSSFTPRLRHDR